MATAFFAKLDPREYQAFLTLPDNDFPKIIEEWEHYIRNKSDEERLKWHPNGHVEEVQINPREFAAYCRATNAKCTLEASR
jgi:hypothetical protein